MFDGEFIKKAKPGIQWSHEDASQMLLEDLVNDNNIPDISTDEVKLIKDLIAGEETDGGGGTGRRILGREGKRFLFDIVANKRNSIDVDKV